MSIFNRVFGLVTAGLLASGPAYAEVCDYKPSKLVGAAASTAAATFGGGAMAAGVGLKAAGYYTLVHSASGLTMLGSTAAGASAAGTTGIIAGSTGIGTLVAGVLMAPVTIFVGAVTLVAVGSYEGVCYFQIERVTDPTQVRGIIESVAINDPAVSITETEDGSAMVLDIPDGKESYLIQNLYIADGDLMHRDWLWNTNLGPVAFVSPELSELH